MELIGQRYILNVSNSAIHTSRTSASFVSTFDLAMSLLRFHKAQCNGTRNVILAIIAFSAHFNSPFITSYTG